MLPVFMIAGLLEPLALILYIPVAPLLSLLEAWFGA